MFRVKTATNKGLDTYIHYKLIQHGARNVVRPDQAHRTSQHRGVQI